MDKITKEIYEQLNDEQKQQYDEVADLVAYLEKRGWTMVFGLSYGNGQEKE